MANQQKIEKIKNGKPFSVVDIFAISAALIIALSFVVYSFINKEEGSVVRITQSKTSQTSFYSFDTDATITVDCDDGQIIVQISKKNKSVKVLSSPCKDKICMHRGEIKFSGESIICLPEQVFIKIESDKEWRPIG